MIASIDISGGTSFAGAGLSWTVGKGPVYVRPAVGVVIHDWPERSAFAGRRAALGSRVLFEPEMAVGYRLNGRISLEASWMHISQGRLFLNSKIPASTCSAPVWTWGYRTIGKVPENIK